MPYDVKLPDIGEGIAEGEIVRWLVRAGDAVREDQPLVEVMTDKASVEIPSPRTGTIAALFAEEGQRVPVGTVIVSIAVAGEAAGGPAPNPPAAHGAPAAAPPAAQAAAPAAGPAGRVQAAPAVRALAKELGIALEALAGSGPGGAITADDVRRAAAAGAAPAVAGAAAPAPGAGDTRVPLRGLRRRIAEHMKLSLQTAAPFTFVAECDWSEVVRHRAAARARAEAAGVRLTFLPYVVRALIQPLREHPLLNASLDDAAHEIVLRRAIHVGVATATPEGLTVPVLHDADRMGLFDVARAIERLAAAARDRSIRLEDLQGATFTVTSTGSKGGVLATPILHHPQVAILGVHEVRKRPAVVDDAIVIRELGNLSLTLDHRVVDGAVGADFLYAVIERLQNPGAWLTEGDLA
uniref:Dihydrolipoamide acetyltransferase component of pyruvate dehydrogenase complex n=1 Tax=Eiseniibacteriota bacterium TaxID=2212470 RepID=A0A832I8I5_UNCEI